LRGTDSDLLFISVFSVFSSESHSLILHIFSEGGYRDERVVKKI